MRLPGSRGTLPTIATFRAFPPHQPGWCVPNALQRYQRMLCHDNINLSRLSRGLAASFSALGTYRLKCDLGALEESSVVMIQCTWDATLNSAGSVKAASASQDMSRYSSHSPISIRCSHGENQISGDISVGTLAVQPTTGFAFQPSQGHRPRILCWASALPLESPSWTSLFPSRHPVDHVACGWDRPHLKPNYGDTWYTWCKLLSQKHVFCLKQWFARSPCNVCETYMCCVKPIWKSPSFRKEASSRTRRFDVIQASLDQPSTSAGHSNWNWNQNSCLLQHQKPESYIHMRSHFHILYMYTHTEIILHSQSFTYMNKLSIKKNIHFPCLGHHSNPAAAPWEV